jgi:GDPmannose 4,6-dehydratase
MAVARIKLGLQEKLFLGNLNSSRDWGYAPDYVRAMWLILQQDQPDDYVIATGETHTVKEFVEKAFAETGVNIVWEGKGIDEKGIEEKTGAVRVEIDKRYFRPTEVDFLLGDPTKAREKLGWEPKVGFSDLVSIMVREDLKEAEKDQLCHNAGFKVYNYHE